MFKKILLGGVLCLCALSGSTSVAHADGDRDGRDRDGRDAPTYRDDYNRGNRDHDNTYRNDYNRGNRDSDDYNRDNRNYGGSDRYNNGRNGYNNGRGRYNNNGRFGRNRDDRNSSYGGNGYYPRYSPAPRYEDRDDRGRDYNRGRGYNNRGRRYDNRNNGTNVVAGAIIGAVIGGAINR